MEGVKMVYFGEKMVSKWYMENFSNKIKNYICELCLFVTKNKKDFQRHIKTKKHGTKWYMAFNNKEGVIECNACDHLSCEYNVKDPHFDDFIHTKKTPKKPLKTPLDCEQIKKCNSVCIEKKHTNTSEFIMDDNNRIVCPLCLKGYKYKSGFYRHKKKCSNDSSNSSNSSILESKNMNIELYNKENTHILLMNAIIQATETNSKLCERIVALENKVSSTNKIVNNNNITNNINKQELNINVFLNQECKNAMNLKDFISKIQLKTEDIDYTATNGYIKGIMNIFIRNLEEMALNERPIHSIQDNRNHQFYIKDENKWECDKKDEKIEESIDSLTKRQIHKIKDWEAQHPNWESSEKGIEEYMKIIQTMMGGQDEKERQQNKEKIKKELVNRVKLDALSITK
jgi:hypothetical protein